MDSFLKKAQDKSFSTWLKGIRRTLHRYPEPSFEEFKTQAIISEILTQIKVPFKNKVAKTGIIADLNEDLGNAKGIALRADMDGLPVNEETGLPFASENPGFMHACGHDGHMAMLLGAIRLLKEEAPTLPIRFLFQPAEEKCGGAKAMIEEGALEGMTMIFGGHIDRHFPPGTISCSEGLICANTDSFEITISGTGGHAARPHEAVDCIVTASLLVMNIQVLVSREVDPLFPKVVTVGEIKGGHTHNCIAEKAVLKGTVRTTDQRMRDMVRQGLERMVHTTSHLYGAQGHIRWSNHYPAVINDPGSTAIALKAATSVVGEENIVPQDRPSLGGEDFSFYQQVIPGCFVRFGARKKGAEGIPAHSPRFDFDESVLPVGAAYLARVAVLAARCMEREGYGS